MSLKQDEPANRSSDRSTVRNDCRSAANKASLRSSAYYSRELAAANQPRDRIAAVLEVYGVKSRAD